MDTELLFVDKQEFFFARRLLPYSGLVFLGKLQNRRFERPFSASGAVFMVDADQRERVFARHDGMILGRRAGQNVGGSCPGR